MNKMNLQAFYGSWRIAETANISSTSSRRSKKNTTIDGAIMTLEESGEMKWNLSSDLDKSFPLFQCDCYEIVQTFVGVCIQMGTVGGHMFEFWVDRPVPKDTLLLTFEGWIMIRCRFVPTSPSPLDFPFTFLPALDEGYFSDIKLSLPCPQSQGSGRQEFKVHSTILRLNECDSEKLSALPKDVLEVVLHYLYTQSLPSNLSLELAERCVSQAQEMPEFLSMAKDYIQRVLLTNKIVKLVNEALVSCTAMASGLRERGLLTSPRFCSVVKKALRDGVVGFMKLVEICVLYGQQSQSLLREERVEIMRYAKARLPVFLTELIGMLKSIKNDFGTMRTSERNYIAGYVTPEITMLLETLSVLMREARDACTAIWRRWSDEGKMDVKEGLVTPPTDDLKKILLEGIFRKREVIKLHHLQGQVAATYLYLAQKKENFEEMSTTVQIRCVSRNLEQLLEELPIFLLRFEEIMMAFDDRFQWKNFKFCLQLAISQVCQAVYKLQEEQEQLNKFFTSFSEFVQRDEFKQSLINLGILKPPQKDTTTDETKPKTSNSEEKSEAKEVEENDIAVLNLVKDICTPKEARVNKLAENCAKILENKKDADMIFEIAQDGESVEIPAHRVILAARCDWFRRALCSGMKESIQKRIVIHDVGASTFQLFLNYIYTGIFKDDLALEVLAELITLADRYEMDYLKSYCEHELTILHLDEACVIFLLNVADQFNAQHLRESCMGFISANPGIMAKEMFEELTPELQMEVYDVTMWYKPNKIYSLPDLSGPRYMLVPDSPSDDDEDSLPYRARQQELERQGIRARQFGDQGPSAVGRRRH